jgi:hypothetical protein
VPAGIKDAGTSHLKAIKGKMQASQVGGMQRNVMFMSILEADFVLKHRTHVCNCEQHLYKEKGVL